jgi:hypothetical protein
VGPLSSHQTVRLARGRHARRELGVCAVELASMLAGDPFSDRPPSVCPVIGAFLRAYNDAVGSARRQDLYGPVARIVGTRADPETERRRLERCVQTARACVARRPRWRHPLGLGRTDGAADLVAWRVARVLSRDGERGHAQALALIDELAAIGPSPRADGPLAAVPEAAFA